MDGTSGSSRTVGFSDGSPGRPLALLGVAVAVGLATWLARPAQRSSPSIRSKRTAPLFAPC